MEPDQPAEPLGLPPLPPKWAPPDPAAAEALDAALDELAGRATRREPE